jgi:hypothetical protein
MVMMDDVLADRVTACASFSNALCTQSLDGSKGAPVSDAAIVVEEGILRHRPFAFFWFSRTLSTAAFHMQGVAVGWKLYELTGSAFDLGMIGLAQFLPVVLFTIVAGHVVDRYDRRLVLAI